MKRLIPCLAFACLTLVSPSASGADSLEGTRRNFVVIFTDDQTYRAIGYNNPQVKTPNLDRLSKDGVVFSNAYVASPICTASRASILTGLFPQQHQSVALSRKGFVKHVVRQKKYKTLAQHLQMAGYTTGFCGKSHLGDPRRYGFQYGKENRDIYDKEAFAFAETFVRDRAKDKKPFLLWIAPKQPHVPLKAVRRWLDLYNDVQLKVDPNFRESPPEGSFFNQGLPGQSYYRDSKHTKNYKNRPAGPPRSKKVIRDFTLAYFATISHLDDQVGQLVAQLRQTGLHDKTVIVFLSDNGYFLGNHGLGNKITMHEESVRVPMFIHDPTSTTQGGKSTELVSSLDVFPTLLDLAGITPPKHAWGKSLVPVIKDPKHHLRDYVASECVGVGGKIGTGHRMIRTKRWKYILSGVGEEALFDEHADMYEMTNLAQHTAHEKVLKEMRSRLRSWMETVGDTHARPPGD